MLVGMVFSFDVARATPVDIISFDVPGTSVSTDIPETVDELRTYLTKIVAMGSRITSHERFDLPVSGNEFIARQSSTDGRLTLVLVNAGLEDGAPLDLVGANGSAC